MKTPSFLLIFVMGILLIISKNSFSQNIPTTTNQRMLMHHEIPQDKYKPYPYNPQKTTSANRFKSSAIFTNQVNVNPSQHNIVGDAANEPSIAVDASNPAKMLIGWRQFDDVNSNFRQAGYAFSSDSGQTWTYPGVLEPTVFRSDPVLDYDNSGNFYYNSLTYDNGSGLYLCKVFKSSNGGLTWDAGTDAHGGDKQWMTIDKHTGTGEGNIYAFWTSYYSSCQPWFFTRSTDNGNFYEDCVFVNGTPYWGTLGVGPDGELYVAGAGLNEGIIVAKSSTAKTTGSTITWDFSKQVDMDGYITGNTPINPVGILGQANIDVDRSNGAGRGNVYVLAAMARISTGDPADVMFSRSTNGGTTWSTPICINDDPSTSNYQWLATMSVAPGGRIDAVWLDTRDAPIGHLYYSALYYSYSMDQGVTWSVNEKLSESFDPSVGYPQQQKMGDYFDMQSDDNGAHLAWANTLNNEEDVYYSHIIPGILGINDKTKKQQVSLSCSPNPFSDQTVVRYDLLTEGLVKMDICNVYGSVVKTVVNQYQTPGIYNTTIEGNGLAAGFYLCRLSIGKLTKTVRLVKI